MKERSIGESRGKSVVRGRYARFSRMLISSAIATVLVLCGGSVANAAGTGAPDVGACFTFNGGAYARLPMNLYQWKNNRWNFYRSGSTNAAGCGTWVDVQGGTYYYAQAYAPYPVGSQNWAYIGYTPAGFVSTSSTDAQWRLPTSPVGQYRIS